MRAWTSTMSASGVTCAARVAARAVAASAIRRKSWSAERSWNADRGDCACSGIVSIAVLLPLERRRRIYPKHPGFRLAGIGPGVRGSALKIEAVAGLEQVVFAVESDFEFAAQHVEKLFAFVGIRVAAAGAGGDAEQVRFHDGVAPGQQFHAHARAGFQNLTPFRAHEMSVGLAGVEEVQNVGF